MDSFELNKILGAVLFTCLVLLSLNIASGAIFSPPKPKKPGYEIAVREQPAAQAKGEAQPKEEPIETLLAKADPNKGKATAKICQTCHTFEKGGPNHIGPNLWGIVGRPRASHPGFNYSAAMKAKGGTWTVDEINKFIHNPRGYIPGTLMTFAGLSRATDRANVIAFLNTLSDNPKPLPTAKAAPEGGKTAEDKAKGGNAPESKTPAPQGNQAPAKPQ